MIKNSFALASFIYLLNSIGNVSQAIFIKHFHATTGIDMYNLITLKCLLVVILMFPLILEHLKHVLHKLHIVIFLATLYASDMLFYNSGLKYGVSANTATLILLTVPLWIVVLGHIVLKERRFNKINAICIVLCLIAIALTVSTEVQIDGFNFGYILVFIDSLIIPVSLILQKKFNDCRPVLYAIWTNAIMLGIISFFMGNCTFPVVNKQNICSALVVAFFDIMECGAVYIAYQMTEVALLQPIRFTRLPIAIVISWLLLNEKVTMIQIVAGTIIITVNLFSMWYSRKYQH